MAYGVEAFVLRTAKRHWRKAYQSDVAASPDPSDLIFNPTTEAPNGGLDNSDVDQGFTDTDGCNLAKLTVYGNHSSADGKAVDMLLSGYSKVAGGTLWVPSYIGRFRWTLGTLVGVASSDVDNTQNFADQVQLVDGDTSVRIITDTVNNVASVTVDLEGASWLKVQWDTAPGTEPDSFNALVSLF
tara:strand:+ start:7804 stop:8358 length:555 start_codon:yes stop_codon:yes gene_type:complete